MDSTWTDTVTAVATAAGTLVTATGLVFIVLQLQAVRRQLTLATCEQLYSRMHGIHEIFIQRPRLRPYFYDQKTPDASADSYQEVCAAAEMVADFFQQVSLQLDLMPEKTAEGWRAYMNDVAKHSPVLRMHLTRNASWYPSRLLAIAEITSPGGDKAPGGSNEA